MSCAPLYGRPVARRLACCTQALLAMGRLDEAEAAFALLHEWTSEGEITFPYVAGAMPLSVRQQAARGQAQARTCPRHPPSPVLWSISCVRRPCADLRMPP